MMAHSHHHSHLVLNDDGDDADGGGMNDDKVHSVVVVLHKKKKKVLLLEGEYCKNHPHYYDVVDDTVEAVGGDIDAALMYGGVVDGHLYTQQVVVQLFQKYSYILLEEEEEEVVLPKDSKVELLQELLYLLVLVPQGAAADDTEALINDEGVFGVEVISKCHYSPIYSCCRRLVRRNQFVLEQVWLN